MKCETSVIFLLPFLFTRLVTGINVTQCFPLSP